MTYPEEDIPPNFEVFSLSWNAFIVPIYHKSTIFIETTAHSSLLIELIDRRRGEMNVFLVDAGKLFPLDQSVISKRVQDLQVILSDLADIPLDKQVSRTSVVFHNVLLVVWVRSGVLDAMIAQYTALLFLTASS